MSKKESSVSDLRLKRVFEIHKCLRNQPYHTEDLLEIVLKIDASANERIIKADIDFLRSLGADIPKGNKHHGFFYKKPFSLISVIDSNNMAETDELIAYIQQISDRSPTILGLDSVLLALEQRVRATEARANPFIDFEKVDSDGLKRLEEFYRYIVSKKVYEIEYTPFNETTENRLILPLFLKEFNHRWTLIAFDKGKNACQNFPLDRIGSRVRLSPEIILYESRFDGNTYFKDIIGVTVRNEKKEEIILKIRKKRAFYVDTKRIHSSQQRINEDSNSMTFKISIIPNLEMWAKFMELAEDLEILEPQYIRDEMIAKLKKILSVNYQ